MPDQAIPRHQALLTLDGKYLAGLTSNHASFIKRELAEYIDTFLSGAVPAAELQITITRKE